MRIRLVALMLMAASPALAEDGMYTTNNSVSSTTSIYSTTNVNGSIYTTSVPQYFVASESYDMRNPADRQRIRDRSNWKEWKRESARDRLRSDRFPDRRRGEREISNIARIHDAGENGYRFRQGRYYSVTATRAAYGAPLYRGGRD